MDEREKIQKQQRIKLFITEIFMFVSVIFMVVFLTLIVTGYSFNLKKFGGEGELIGRTGLVQISSVPTGASINIDGGSPLLLRTNGSRALGVGEHEIVLTKDGYGEWKKTIEVTEGIMYRLNYPRLFSTTSEQEKLFSLQGLSSVAVSPSGNKALIVQSGKLYIMDLNNNKPVINSLDLVVDGKKIEKIESFEEMIWSENGERLLAKVNGDRLVIGTKNNTAVSVDALTKDLKIRKIRFESEAGDKLIVLTETSELAEVDIRAKKVSDVLLTKVIDFDNEKDAVIYLTEGELRAYQIGSENSYSVYEIEGETANFVVTEYYDEYIVGIESGNKFVVLSGEDWPGENYLLEKVFEEEVGFATKKLTKRGKGMVIAISGNEGQEMVFDAEAMKLINVELSGKNGWIDEFLRFEASEEGEVFAVDYDGLNRRELIKTDVDVERGIYISGNNKWLYYFSGETLARERIN